MDLLHIKLGLSLLQRRLFGKGFSTAVDLALKWKHVQSFGSAYTRKGNYMGEVFSAVLDGDSNVIREYDTNDIDYGIYDAGEK